MKKILVPFDFSKPAINAFRFALDTAVQSKGEVYLLNAIELPVIHDPVIMPAITFEQSFLRDMRDKTFAELEKVNAKFNTEKVNVMSVVEFGYPGRMIPEYAEENAIDIIIMGSHGASGMREILIGSNAQKIVRRSPLPVLVLKNYRKGPVKNIVFPHTLETGKLQDFTMKVKALQDFFKAKIHIVFINTPETFTSDAVTNARLEAFAKQFMFRNYSLNIFSDRSEEEGIIHFTESIKGDLIAMGTHGRKGLAKMITGSIAEDVVNHTDSAIWTYNLTREV